MRIKINLAIYIICLSGLFSSCHKAAQHPCFSFPQEIPLYEGDIVFRQGRSIASQAVLSADRAGYYSHIGIVVMYNDKWQVVHAVPDEPDFEGDTDRVKMDELGIFFSRERANSGALMRVTNNVLAKEAAKKALDIFHRKVLFDHKYDLKDTLEMYCTELVYHVYNLQDMDLTEGRRSKVAIPGYRGTYIFPSDIQQSSDLNLIYNF